VEELSPLCEEVSQEGRVRTPMGVEEERDVPVHLCRRLREPLRQLWDRLGPAWG
jgi:hypothetical protein